MAFNWTCPHCNHRQTISEDDVDESFARLRVTENVYDEPAVKITAVACVNPDCHELTVHLELAAGTTNFGGWLEEKKLLSTTIWPESSAKVQPDYIPKPIRDDYVEACRIKNLSPKASATLSRRCMQGMIRDFCGINDVTLYAQIKTLERLKNENNAPKGVFDETIVALHDVRKIGNIGAHMEVDINLIVDIDSNEAAVLIELIETLFEEWYVARHQRAQRLSKLQNIALEKEAAKKGETDGQSQTQT